MVKFALTKEALSGAREDVSEPPRSVHENSLLQHLATSGLFLMLVLPPWCFLTARSLKAQGPGSVCV